MATEAGDNLIKNQERTCVLGDLSQLLQVFTRLEIRASALYWFDQDRSEFVRTGFDDLHRFRRAVVKNDHVVRGARHDAWCCGNRAQFLGGAHDDFVKYAVVGAGEKRDQIASGHRTCDAYRAHDGFGAGIAQARAIKAGHFTDELCDLARERMLRTDFVALVELFSDCRVNERRLPAKQIHTKTIQHIDVFIAIDVPDARTFGTTDNNLVNHFLQHRAEAIDHARVGQMRPV